MHPAPVFTTSPTPSPTHPLSVPYTSPTSPTNVPRFQAFHLKKTPWRCQGNHAIDKFMANVAATIGEQQPGMMPGSSTGASPIPKPSATSCSTRHGPSQALQCWCLQSLATALARQSRLHFCWRLTLGGQPEDEIQLGRRKVWCHCEAPTQSEGKRGTRNNV